MSSHLNSTQRVECVWWMLLLFSSIIPGAFSLSFHLLTQSPSLFFFKHISASFSLLWNCRIWILRIHILCPPIFLTYCTVNKTVYPFLMRIFHTVGISDHHNSLCSVLKQLNFKLLWRLTYIAQRKKEMISLWWCSAH